MSQGGWKFTPKVTKRTDMVDDDGIGPTRTSIVNCVTLKRLFSVMLLTVLAMATDGTFSGQVVNGPALDGKQKWIYVQAAKGRTRRVDISSAKLHISSHTPSKDRAGRPEDVIREGMRVRVTATQDTDGEWKASEIEILESSPR
jgi:hypothetical protein